MDMVETSPLRDADTMTKINPASAAIDLIQQPDSWTLRLPHMVPKSGCRFSDQTMRQD
jgi:hypothetical protein